MAYIGNSSPSRFVSNRAASVYSGDGTTTDFTLEQAVVQDEDILVSVDGVIQEPSVAYAVSNGTTLAFTGAPSSNAGNNIFVYYLASQVGTVGHPSNQALSAASVTIPDDGDIGSTSKTNAIEIASNGNLTFNLTNGTAQAIQNSSGSNIIYGSYTNHGLNFRTNNTLNMAIDTTGAVTMPLQPAFLAKPSGDQSNIAEDSDVVVALATEIFDQNADFASNAFTAPVTGRYQISYNLRMSHLQTGANYYFIKLVTSNRTIISAYDPIAFDVNDLPYWTFTLSLLVDMDANDTCQLKVNQQGSGSAVSDIIAQDTYLSGYLVA
jgi:hypothetical protein